MTRPYEIVALEARHQGWASLFIASILGPNGEVFRREIEEHGQAVGLLPYDPERRLALLIRQFRAPLFHATGETEFLECPAGLLDKPDPEAEGKRELWEEIGLRASRLERVTTAWMMPGLSTERIHLFLVPFSAEERQGKGGGLATEHERITSVEVALAELARMADDGRLTDMKTLFLVQTLRLRRPELFGP